MFAALKRHPLAVEAFFEYSLVLTFALPEATLAPLLPPGLELDSYAGNAFVAIALVQTKALRPRGLPAWLGKDFFLSGYRIFTRHRTLRGQVLRGLFILRSDANSRWLVQAGNLLTHYRYRLAHVTTERSTGGLAIEVQTPDGEADLALQAQLDTSPAEPPAGSPFPDWATARRFAGPLPHTFDYEAATHSLVVVKGVRKAWEPRPIAVTVERCTFFDAKQFEGAEPRLANAFFLQNVPYRWKPGVLFPLPPQSLPPQSLPPQSLPPQSLPPQSLPPQSLPPRPR